MSRRQNIGFDRPLELSWLDAVAAKVAEGASPPEVRSYLYSILEGVVAGSTKNSAGGKTVTVLSHIWCLVPERAVALRDRALERLPTVAPEERLAIHWAMMVATYPFFTDVASTLGRLLSLHDRVSTLQVRVRIDESWGMRSTTFRAIPRLLSSIARWGILKRLSRDEYTGAGNLLPVPDDVGALLVEAVLVDSEKKAMEVTQALRHPALFPFELALTTHALRGYGHFSVHRQGVDQDVVSLARKRMTLKEG